MEKSPVSKTVNTGIKLDETLHMRLKVLGSIKDRSPHWLMRAAIEEYVQREEQYEREKNEDIERWERYKLSGKSIPQSGVEEWLGSWGEKSGVPCPK